MIIASNSHIAKAGVNFTTFTLHMALGVFLVMIQTYFQLRLKYRNINDLRFSEAQDVQELRHEIAVWQRAAASLSSYSKDEDLVRETLVKKVNRLTRQLKKKLMSGSVPIESYRTTLEDLQSKVGSSFVVIVNLDLNYSFFSTPFATEYCWLNRESRWCLWWPSSFCTRCPNCNGCLWDGLLYLEQFCCLFWPIERIWKRF